MIIQTSRFGEVKIKKEDIIFMPDGVIGFHDEKRFAIIERVQEIPFYWLQAVDTPDLAFIIIDPHLFAPDYQPVVARTDREILKATGEDPLEFYAIVTVPEKSEEMTANLIAPLCMNPGTHLAKQIILSDARYCTRHRIIEEMNRNIPQADDPLEQESGGGGTPEIPTAGPAVSSGPMELSAL